MKSLVLPLALLLIGSLANAQSIETLWRARAIDGAERAKALSAKAKLTDKEKCELIVANGYATLNDKGGLKSTGVNDGVLVANLNFVNKRSVMLVTVVIPKESKAPLFVMPKSWDDPAAKGSWQIMLNPDLSGGAFALSSEECDLLFSSPYLEPTITVKTTK